MNNKQLKPNVLLVEDDKSVANVISYNLQKQGYNVIVVHDGEKALITAKNEKPDLILLDWMLPLKSGIEVCTILRSYPECSHTPIIMISAKDDDLDKVTGLDRGADDYMTKPFSPFELAARMRAVLRRIRPAFSDKMLKFSDIEMDLSSHCVMRGSKEVKLAPIEFQILQMLMEKPERVLSRNSLISKIWGTEIEVDTRTVDVHITRLRKALLEASNNNKEIIKTVRLAGYKLTL